jgi:hypothetical protein
MAQSAVDKIPPDPQLVNVTINFSKLVLRIRPRRVTNNLSAEVIDR